MCEGLSSGYNLSD